MARAMARTLNGEAQRSLDRKHGHFIEVKPEAEDGDPDQLMGGSLAPCEKMYRSYPFTESCYSGSEEHVGMGLVSSASS